MKFLCIPCGERMKITRAEPPAGGASISAVFACPSCSHQIAMLTNAQETELVQSMGLKIGPGETSRPSGVTYSAAKGAGETVAATAAERAEAGGCPFAGMVGEIEARKDDGIADDVADGIAWTAEAEARLLNVPEFVRPMARQGIEHFAKSNGHAVVDDAVMEKARVQFGM